MVAGFTSPHAGLVKNQRIKRENEELKEKMVKKNGGTV